MEKLHLEKGAMGRKPYQAKLANDWFMKQPHFIHYMIREFTCVGIGLYILNLMAGIVALANSEQSWMGWVAAQTNPVMVIISLFAFASALFHSYTWFGVTPKVFRIPHGDRFVPGKWIILGHWVVFIIIAMILTIIVKAAS